MSQIIDISVNLESTKETLTAEYNGVIAFSKSLDNTDALSFFNAVNTMVGIENDIIINESSVTLKPSNSLTGLKIYINKYILKCLHESGIKEIDAGNFFKISHKITENTTLKKSEIDGMIKAFIESL